MPNHLTKRESSLTTTKPKKKTPKNAELILADLSSSMYGDPYKILSQALKPLAQTAHVLAFNSRVFEVNADDLPHPDGWTALHLALDKAIDLEPLHVLVISDGAPDNADKAKESAQILSSQCIIDVLYVGSAGNDACIAFMKQLAEIGRGRYQELDIVSVRSSGLLLGSKVDNLLALPAPKGAINL